MPYINVKVAGKLTKEQKARIARGFSEILEKVAGKPKKATTIVFDEVKRENWAQGDELLE